MNGNGLATYGMLNQKQSQLMKEYLYEKPLYNLKTFICPFFSEIIGINFINTPLVFQ